MMRQYELVERVKSYDPTADEDLLNRAYVFSMQAHGNQTRESGDPYFSHPLDVAGILTEMKMDSAAIATALLHDTVEDTGVTLADIEKHFGAEIARLVDGVTKLSRIEFQNDQAAKQAENFRKLVVAMSTDIRILLIKLADRLHNMRTLHFVKNPDKRTRIARETLDIYAPLAERIGIEKMQDELQDLAFAEINPDARDSIVARLNYLRSEGGNIAERIRVALTQLLEEEGLHAEIEGREKKPYSIWRKMNKKDISFEQLSDIMAFRILVDTVGNCYQALGIIHNHFHGIPGRFKDYISTPKPNKYQSIHTTIIGPERHRIEIQIRTHEMHEVAELGVAAHWSYKQGAQASDSSEYRWLRDILDIVEHAQKPEEFLEHTRLELFQDQVFCFSPKGDLIALPRGATPVDFAYAVHSRIGDECVGSKVNGRMVPLRTELHNGDQVEIITQKNGTPSPAWERFVVSGKARSRIRRFVRIQQRVEYIALGRAMLEKLCRQENVDFGEKPFEAIAKNFQASNIEDLFANVGASLQSARDVFYAAYPEQKAKPVEKLPADVEAAAQKIKTKATPQSGTPLTLKGLIPGMAVHFARCCHPLPGDRIVGIVATGRGVTIHTRDCDTLESFRDMPERWIDVDWGDNQDKGNLLVGRLNVVLTNKPNSLGALTTIIGKSNANITNLKITNRSIDFFDILVDVEVNDTDHLLNVIAALRSNSAIVSVERAKPR
ncbi:MAG: bifunctional (p)ppGpp synthetase/guanosine-3',5'-bis(diphosphate) 3'-pyrophosphohydrolase [Proteobacteria bacterium]|nr:bifunctional (p)ppGpp synthetase/guanosine-3',5'-bis(diphosphate) 3'-pyrophosphohydrolase [Alphaproteobacteria bacterium]NCC02463.1 bifunctional (p)ppGpp synthetase/guanosine-3',5'-bis(diphosphate) 3'-pyrophosphohydrolase [Pseudomonadota bacterium]